LYSEARRAVLLAAAFWKCRGEAGRACLHPSAGGQEQGLVVEGTSPEPVAQS